MALHRRHGAIDRRGVDLAVAQGGMLDGFVSYADMRLGNADTAETRIDPIRLRGGMTFHF
ncbi:MAG: hypothetical protein ACOC0M_11480 [Halomonas sp.]